MYITDMLSCAYLQVQSSAHKTDYQIFQLNQEAKLYKEVNPAKHVRLSENRLASVREARMKLSTVIHQEFKQTIQLFIRMFWSYRDELVVDPSIIYKGTEVLIPNSMRAIMLQRIHSSHQGPEAC